MQLLKVHHIAIICGDYATSKKFYTEVLGLEIIQEQYRVQRDSYKLDLALNGEYIIELFSFPNPPARPSRPEAMGLRHLAFAVPDIEASIEELKNKNIEVENFRIDELTNKKFTFFPIQMDYRLNYMKYNFLRNSKKLRFRVKR